jgi:integral membrane protein
MGFLDQKHKHKNLKRFRTIGILEGISYLLLFGVTMPLKYLADMPLPNYIVGMAHGFLFVAYVFGVLVVRNQFKTGLRTNLILLLASFLPFGTFYTDKKYLSELEKQV